MSYNGLIQQEKQAKALYKKIERQLKAELADLKLEIEKVKLLLGNPIDTNKWANEQAGGETISRLLARMSETEQLYMSAGNSRAATIFKSRMNKQLESRLTNLQATELDLKLRLEKIKHSVQQEVLTGMSDVRREAVTREMYEQAREVGGFLGNFGRPYLNDLVTLETKAAGSKTLGEYMSNLFNTYEKGLKDALIHGIIRGDSYEMMEQHLQDATNITAGKARLLIRTEANAIFNDGVKRVIEDNPLVAGYRFRAVLDSHTSKICQEHDGEFISKDNIQPGINYPPLHPNCRSTVTTVLVGEEDKTDTVQRYTKNGRHQWEKVPKGMNYQEYKDKFGFSNSKNPKTYNPETRDIHDATLAKVTVNTYKGYVKPSASSTARIEKTVKAYISGDSEYIDAVKQNTGYDTPVQAMLRQSQAEAGFDGLPLQLTANEFDKQVAKNNYIKVYRKFGRAEDLDEFVEGSQDYLKVGKDVYGTKVFTDKPEDMSGVVELALKSDENRILRLPSRASISEGISGDARIDNILSTAPEGKRASILSSLAIEYGYDAVSFEDEGDMAVLNRTAVLVKQSDSVEVPDVSLRPERYSDQIVRMSYIAPNDKRIVVRNRIKVVNNVPSSAAMLDHNLSSEVSAEAKAIYKKAREAEPAITNVLVKAVDDIPGARLDGIEFNVKTGSSLEGKIARKMADDRKAGLRVATDAEYVGRMTDLVRYTEVVPVQDDIVGATKDVMKRLENEGLECIELDNKYIDGDGSYKGVHLLFKDKSGVVFEYQVHSEESMIVKNTNHELYEIARDVRTPDDEKIRLEMEMRQRAASLKNPEGIETLKSFDKRHKKPYSK